VATPRVPQDRKARAPRKATTTKVSPSGPRSLVEIVTTDQPEVELIPLFSIDGEVYSIPAEVSASMALRVLDTARREGMEAAMSGALEELLGPDAYQALLHCKSLTTDHLEAIMAGVQGHVLGGLDGPLGN
jgi:hypothetical protein